MEKRRFALYALFLLFLLVIGLKISDPREGSVHETVASSSMPQSAPVPQRGWGLLGTAQAAEVEATPVTELDWDALIPPEWQLDKLMADYDTDSLSDDDPRAKELMNKLKTFWKEAPVVKELNGKRVKLPGFVVPLEMDTKTIGEFLLVPYYGACIHVPPPPSNQTVHVVTQAGKPYKGQLFDTVWVTGTLKVQSLSSELADAGYRIDATKVEPYE